jgi:hypothetical protein
MVMAHRLSVSKSRSVAPHELPEDGIREGFGKFGYDFHLPGPPDPIEEGICEFQNASTHLCDVLGGQRLIQQATRSAVG